MFKRLNGRVWKRLTVGQRRYVLDEINDENYDSSMLDDIAPQLQRGELPEESPDIQCAYVNENRLQPRSRDSIDISREMLSRELKELHDKIDKINSDMCLLIFIHIDTFF